MSRLAGETIVMTFEQFHAAPVDGGVLVSRKSEDLSFFREIKSLSLVFQAPSLFGDGGSHTARRERRAERYLGDTHSLRMMMMMIDDDEARWRCGTTSGAGILVFLSLSLSLSFSSYFSLSLSQSLNFSVSPSISLTLSLSLFSISLSLSLSLSL